MTSPSWSNRAVFLDRDGVVYCAVIRDGRPYSASSLGEIELVPGVPEAIKALRRAGYRIIIVTNQPDVPRGLQRREAVERIHKYLRQVLEIDDIKVCYHVDEDACACRKPKPGMLFEAAREWSLALSQSFMVGNRWRDIEAGKAAGCRTVWIRNDYRERQPENPDAIVGSLYGASVLIVSMGE